METGQKHSSQAERAHVQGWKQNRFRFRSGSLPANSVALANNSTFLSLSFFICQMRLILPNMGVNWVLTRPETQARKTEINLNVN